jgi:hypothetical protein
LRQWASCITAYDAKRMKSEFMDPRARMGDISFRVYSKARAMAVHQIVELAVLVCSSD